MGELVLFDPAQGRHEADGVVQRIPGYGKKVEPVDRRRPGRRLWPKFLHPYPLSDKYFLVSCQADAGSRHWGIYLVDVFDNMLLLQRASRAMPCSSRSRCARRPAAGHPRPASTRAARTPRSTWPTSTRARA